MTISYDISFHFCKLAYYQLLWIDLNPPNQIDFILNYLTNFSSYFILLRLLIFSHCCIISNFYFILWTFHTLFTLFLSFEWIFHYYFFNFDLLTCFFYCYFLNQKSYCSMMRIVSMSHIKLNLVIIVTKRIVLWAKILSRWNIFYFYFFIKLTVDFCFCFCSCRFA